MRHETVPAMRNVSRVVITTVILMLCACFSELSQAQDASNRRGFQPGNSYAIGDFETINTTNGNLMLRLPLGSLPTGRNGLSAGIYLLYNSKLLDSEVKYFPKEDQSCKIIGQDPDAVVDCPYYQKSLLKDSDEGGWRLGIGYSLKVIDRHDQYASLPMEKQPQCSLNSSGYYDWRYRYKLMLTFPDGSSHEMRPNGWRDGNSNDALGDYFDIRPDGFKFDCQNFQWYPNTITYYSIDGSFLRLDIQHDGNTNGAWQDNPWTLYFPDGSKVTTNQPGGEAQRFYDRNNNYVEFPGNGVRDQFNRSVTISGSSQNGVPVYTITSQGFGATLTWTITWKQIRVLKNYWPCAETLACDPYIREQEPYGTTRLVVDRITLPTQAGGLTYIFEYNAPDAADPFGTSHGWGEISGITMPSGAHLAYTYNQDGSPQLNFTPEILRNAPTSKVLTYNQEYDGVPTPVSETWTYTFESSMSTITAPDGGVTTNFFVDVSRPFWNSGLTLFSIAPDGTKTETIWDRNNLADNASVNPYARTVFTSIKNAAGDYVKTAIKDFKYDKNGNVTRLAEYDWVNYDAVPRAQGLPTGLPAAIPTRVTVNTYFNATPDATEFAGDNSSVYWSSGSPRVKNAAASTEIRMMLPGGAEQALTRSEFSYDNSSAPANVTQTRSWDSSKGGYTSPLLIANSITVSTAYNNYGMPTLTTDARGIQTSITYDAPSGGIPDLYPTQIQTAYGTPVKRTEQRTYDFPTGLVTKVTDVDNKVSTVTSYDALGRPTLIRAADGYKDEETQTSTQYFDSDRRVVVRRDLDAAGDGLMVSVEHYDQLGRLRLSRVLEDSANGVDIETMGIKTQTRYRYSGDNSFHLISNPYRAATSTDAASEPTMGWTRTKADTVGRTIEVKTFSGNGLPAPWGDNVSGTGAVATIYDGIFSTVTDQAGKIRRSKVDGLGRLIRVDEPSNAANNLGSQDSPTQPTNYQYDSVGHITLVTQGDQTRSFGYSSLGRLITASNPESGVVMYEYDENGNVKKKIDPRLVPNTSIHRTITYDYDGLGRVTARTYNDGTPNVSYSYDSSDVAFSKGRLATVTSSVSSYSYEEYDALGRVKRGTQTTAGQSYKMSYEYNAAGGLISQKYPSGRVVRTNYDNAGRIAGVSNNANGAYYAGAASADATNQLQYSAAGAIQAMKLGNGLWEHTNFNSCLQPVQIGLGSASTNSTVLQLDYSYGTTNNNGNVQSQTITVPTLGTVSGFTATQTYTYDWLNRLATAKENNGNSWQQNFDYDRYGNRKLISGTNLPAPLTPENNPVINPQNNRIDNTVSGQTNILYDNAGNLTRETAGHTYQYDADNRMVNYDGGAGSAGGANYSYDGDGRRIKKVVGGAVVVTTVFVYNVMGQLIAEYADSASTGNGTSYLTSDPLGSPRVITGVNQQVKGRHDYLPFGEELGTDTGGRKTAQGYSASDGVRQHFTQKERDNETGLDYFAARYYSSTPGRFVSPDDFLNDTHPADPQTWNLYSYVRNNPLRYIDPDGQIKKDKDGNIIFDKTGEGTVVYKEQPLKDNNGNVINDKDGNPLTIKIFWKADKGNVYADDGTKIEAYRATGEIQVTVKDHSGNVLSDFTAAAQNLLKDQGVDNSKNCNGTTFAEGQVWINNNQIPKIIRGDNYVSTSSPKARDVGIYTIDGNLNNPVHSVLVNSVDSKGGVVDVTSKGGITPRVNIAPGPGPNSAWKDPTVKLQYFTQRVSGSKQ